MTGDTGADRRGPVTPGGRDLAGCPAQFAGGVAIGAAEFTFVAHDCGARRKGVREVTEIFGYFREPGTIDDDARIDDALQTGVLEVGRNSPLARLGRQIAGDPTFRAQARLAAILRENVLICPHTDRGECPALSRASFAQAMKDAIGRPDGEADNFDAGIRLGEANRNTSYLDA